MQADARRHIVIDTNVLCAYLNSKTVHDKRLAERAAALITAAVENDWQPIQLYVPAFAIAEAQHVLDKYRFCKWSGPTKTDSSKRLSADEYNRSRDLLYKLLNDKSCARVDILPDHLPASSLVSLVNSKYQITRKKSNFSSPMSAADCLVAAIAIDVGIKVGSSRVAVVTDDRRMWRVLQRCKRLPPERARTLPLQSTANKLGVAWSVDLYPDAVLLTRANESQLCTAFGGWPLPKTFCPQQKCSDLNRRLQQSLWTMAMTIKENGGPGPDSLPYSDSLDQLQVNFAHEHSIYLLRSDISKTLLTWRKAKKFR